MLHQLSFWKIEFTVCGFNIYSSTKNIFYIIIFMDSKPGVRKFIKTVDAEQAAFCNKIAAAAGALVRVKKMKCICP